MLRPVSPEELTFPPPFVSLQSHKLKLTYKKKILPSVETLQINLIKTAHAAIAVPQHSKQIKAASRNSEAVREDEEFRLFPALT